MLEDLGEAEAILEALKDVFEEGVVVTPDLAGAATTEEFGDKVCKKQAKYAVAK
ncbi:hypothetical protein [Peribacillus glennii]|uniref:hypothetical protein n=1 Tax=Peribacillus glennii TaxID=2303991 RepID=UPI0013149F4F|nr:hypothetical protein [Peribacillus glennii]